jgi:poly(3-hydroxybutyrate) depolymerase
MLALYPEKFSGGAVIGGLPHRAADTLQGALAAMRGVKGSIARTSLDPAGGSTRLPRVCVWHGLSDTTVTSSNGLAVARQWTQIHGLTDAPHVDETLPGRRRTRWMAGDEVVVECNLMPGFGHGTPVATRGEDPIGAEAPFILEAGISSSLEILRFWELADPDLTERPQASPISGPSEPAKEMAEATGLAGQILGSVAPHVSAEVQDVIAKALRQAGLR